MSVMSERKVRTIRAILRPLQRYFTFPFVDLNGVKIPLLPPVINYFTTATLAGGKTAIFISNKTEGVQSKNASHIHFSLKYSRKSS